MTETTQDLESLRKRLNRIEGKRDELTVQQADLQAKLASVNGFLEIADSVTAALEQLGNDIFKRQLTLIENTMTKALQEVLEQPIVFKTNCTFKRDAASVEFLIERDGNPEDIMKGQGGSVANVVSVGLRMLAIATLDERRHRRFLVLDEQDCWLHPDLVPKLTQIVQRAGTELGFQVLMISHHDVTHFIRHADKVYRLSPDRGDGVGLEQVVADAPQEAENY
ncbi:hypothetical protein SAMN06265222_11642 [Neorhodopirellula lusitana]|uniref:Uncharacterized protein n=1 Tax=Neorhodopirellula lusitana TaxID=445327 RepID=A0ABY1QJD0_9BACT|nr:DNA repair protein [Neorhodopirellula lusitana]SMP73169.1 hypothetical protein SAMN06265222_11642 [Neorhodopirellula lusitana]